VEEAKGLFSSFLSSFSLELSKVWLFKKKPISVAHDIQSKISMIWENCGDQDLFEENKTI